MSTGTPAVKTRMTADEFWEFVNRPENEARRFELIRGEVVEMSVPNRLHGIAQSNLDRFIGNWAAEVDRGYVVVESGVVLHEGPATVVGPDVAYYLDAEEVADVHPKWGDIPPVLAVEILSPNDRPSRVNARVREYLSSGTKLVWVVDPEDRTVSEYRPSREFTMVGEGDDLTGGEELPGLTIRVAAIFQLRGKTPAPKPPAAG